MTQASELNAPPPLPAGAPAPGYQAVLDDRLNELVPQIRGQLKMGVALAGPAGSGKTTTCNYLSDFHGFRKVSFAASLKSIAKNLYGDLNQNARRRMLQCFGQALRAVWGPTWIFRALRTIQEDQLTKVCIDDLRFVNEAEILKACGFVLIYNHVPVETCIERLKSRDGEVSPDLFDDISEKDLARYQGFNYVLDQSQDFATVQADLKRVLPTLEKRSIS